MTKSLNETYAELTKKSMLKKEEENHKAGIRRSDTNHKAELAERGRQEKSELEVKNQAELAKLNLALTPEQLGHQYDYYVKVKNIDLQAFDHRENLLAFLEAQASKQQHDQQQQEIISAVKRFLIEEEARRATEEQRHQHTMEKARLDAELEVATFKAKHEFLHELYRKSSDVDRKRMQALFTEFELETPKDPQGF